MTFIRKWTRTDLELEFVSNLINTLPFGTTYLDNEVSGTSLWEAKLEKALDDLVTALKDTNPKAAVMKGRDFSLFDVVNVVIEETQLMTANELSALGEKARDELNDALVAGLEKLRFSRQTQIGRDFYEALDKISKIFVGQLGDYIVEFLTLDSDKLIQVDENRIFIRVPTPQLQFLQILDTFFPNSDSSDFDRWISPKSWEEAFFIIVAALRKPFVGREQNSFSAEIVDMKYIRQWDGKWLEVESDCDISLAKAANKNREEKHSWSLTDNQISYKEGNYSQSDSEPLVRLYLPSSYRNRVVGALGIPDSEVYNDMPEIECEIKELPQTAKSSESDFNDYFSSSDSPAKSCFPIITTGPYKQMTSSDLCLIASAYQQRCYNEGVMEFDLPIGCEKTQFMNFSFAM